MSEYGIFQNWDNRKKYVIEVLFDMICNDSLNDQRSQISLLI
jgi:hypothetical protein